MLKLTSEQLRRALDGKLLTRLCGTPEKCIHAKAMADNFQEFVSRAEQIYAAGSPSGLSPEVSVMYTGFHLGYMAALIQFNLEEAVLHGENDEAKAD